ncbi:MAG: transglycosylase SLT domain-containing protein [Pseudomonadota bacterium]
MAKKRVKRRKRRVQIASRQQPVRMGKSDFRKYKVAKVRKVRGRKARRKFRKRIARARTRGRLTTARKSRVMAAVRSHARRAGISQSMALAVVRQESSFNPKARGSVGEIGLMQVKCATARSVGYKGSCKGLYNVNTNLKYGMRYLKKALKRGSVGYYNAGIYAKRLPKQARKYASSVKRKQRNY